LQAICVSVQRTNEKAIAANQVIQHGLADLFVEIEEVRLLVHAAALTPTPRMAAACAAYIS
jgi:alkylation response protein AidB-like acyl-CoA dehydrogenase